MMQVQVHASDSYTVRIGSRLLSAIGETVTRLTSAKKVCIVSDSHVWPLYGEKICQQLNAASLEHCHFVFPAGENIKNLQTYQELLNFLAEHQLTRTDCIIALGGGVVGDLAGFAAATWLRGIPYIQVPTTLLAMVDSSVGGKTAINLPVGKNLCGAFYQPVAVLCDTDTLDTLPQEVFLDGCAEVIKYGVLYDQALFTHLTENGPHFDRETVIAQCIEHKSNVVALDEFDTAERMKLNLGHTLGHAIERCSDYTVSHGKAVAMGMAMVCKASHCPDYARIRGCLQKFFLPTTTDYSAEALLPHVLSDKKRSANTVNLIIPRAIGDCRIVPTAIENLKTFIEEGL